MAKRPTGGKTQDEANVHILDYIALHGDDRLGVYHDIGNKIEREVRFLTEVVAEGKIDNDEKAKEKVYDTSLALRKLKNFCGSRPEFKRFYCYFDDAEALLKDDDFVSKGYKEEMERGFADGDNEYASLKKNIEKKISSASSTQTPDQPTANDKNSAQNHASDNRKRAQPSVKKQNYDILSKKIKENYDGVRQGLKPGDYAGELDSFERELEQYKAIDEKILTEPGKVDRKTDIENAQKKINEAREKIDAYNDGWFYHGFEAMINRHNGSIPRKVGWAKKGKRDFAVAVESAVDDVNHFELDWSDTMTKQQRHDLERYMKAVKNMRNGHEMRTYFTQLVESIPW